MSRCKKIFHGFTNYEKTSSKKGIVGFLIKNRIAKNEGFAKIQLIIVSIFFFALSKLIF